MRAGVLVVGLVTTVALAVIACRDESAALPGSSSALLEADARLELFSLSPVRVTVGAEKGFHGWRVLGSKAIDDSKTRAAVVSAVATGIREHEDQAAACFRPRHGLRVAGPIKTVDLVICFECFRSEVYAAGELERSVGTTASPQSVLDGVLRDAAVELAAPP